MDTKTDKQQLAEQMFPQDLKAFARDLLKSGASYREVADAVNDGMPNGIKVSREAIRRWYGTVSA